MSRESKISSSTPVSSTENGVETPSIKEPGKVLRAKRVEKGITLEKAREDTKIPYKFILALEDGNGKAFPAKVYYRGFFLNYCKYLGVPDGEILWTEVLQFDSPLSIQLVDKAKESHSPQTLAHSDKVKMVRAYERGILEQFSLWMLEGQNWIIVFVIAPAVILASFFGIYSYSKQKMYRSQPVQTLDVYGLLGHPKNIPVKGAASTVQSGDGKILYGVQQAITLELLTKAEPCWMQVELDGEISFQGVLPGNQRRTFTANQKAKIRLGNPRSIDLKVNSAPWSFSRQDLEKTPLELTFTPEMNSKIP